MASWKNLPDVVFYDIMMMIGLNSLEDLHRCRQVSQSWNVMIAQMTKHKKIPIRKKAECLASQIKGMSRFELLVYHLVDLPKMVTDASSLAQHGMLDTVNYMLLQNTDLVSIPTTEHLASLASCVTHNLGINNVSNCDLISILDSVKCKGLHISRQTLSSEETRSLVRAMESRMEEVKLGVSGEVSLDIRALTKYSGQGKCGKVVCWDATADRYREEVRSWAEKINWKVTLDNDIKIVIERK